MLWPRQSEEQGALMMMLSWVVDGAALPDPYAPFSNFHTKEQRRLVLDAYRSGDWAAQTMMEQFLE